MRIIYINSENKQINFNGSMQEALELINKEALCIVEISLEALQKMMEMINEFNISEYRNFMEVALIAVLKKLC
ncbi:hypothetical protein IMSAGC017_01938 [Thomasclavelia cocleata]|uniref:Uncharacterized protein n=1 Tax=Thomasclavelia cocleata TaxID=69824 RepID=A0A829ZD35_9FIRM|nr:hypothetical protein [Thomasclavelia cocleata]GFI41892.1 hypothetical protein IMSAGC017_01938 [Thomasclavelia cocleata]